MSFYAKHAIIYQDRLGTNMDGKHSKKDAFLQRTTSCGWCMAAKSLF